MGACIKCSLWRLIYVGVSILQVVSYGANAEATATTTVFTRMLQHSLKDSQGLSQHPAATGLAIVAV